MGENPASVMFLLPAFIYRGRGRPSPHIISSRPTPAQATLSEEAVLGLLDELDFG